jgi:hypothetical protein
VGKEIKLELERFQLTPAVGTILPGEQVDVIIFFKGPEAPKVVTEQVMVNISDVDPSKYPENITYELTGESKLSGINTNPDVIFEEHRVIDELDTPGITPPYGIYSKNENLFSFGAFIIDCERQPDGQPMKGRPSVRFTGDTSKPKQPIATIGKKLEANFRIDNPFKVPCFVDFLVTPIMPNLETQSPYEEPFAISVQPAMLEIPPHEFRLVEIGIAWNKLSIMSFKIF